MQTTIQPVHHHHFPTPGGPCAACDEFGPRPAAGDAEILRLLEQNDLARSLADAVRAELRACGYRVDGVINLTVEAEVLDAILVRCALRFLGGAGIFLRKGRTQ